MQFDADPYLINCLNGTYDLRDFSFREHSWDDFLTMQTAFSHASLLERLKARIEESAIKVSTVKAPHTYMKAVGTRELEKILEEELGNEDTK